MSAETNRGTAAGKDEDVMNGVQERGFENAPLGYKFKRIHEMFCARANADLKQIDLTYSQMEILFYLSHQTHEVSQKELCEAVQVSHPTMIGLISRMEEKGLLIRRQDGQDRRKNSIEMTEKAREILKETKKRHQRDDAMLVRGFSEEEARLLNELLSRVYRNMQQDVSRRQKEGQI